MGAALKFLLIRTIQTTSFPTRSSEEAPERLIERCAIEVQDESYLDALVRMFEQALKISAQLHASDRNGLIARLDRVRVISHHFGYGVGDDMDSVLAKYVRE